MKLKVVHLFLMFFITFASSVYGQGRYTKIEKNLKAGSLGMEHDLNKLGDSIIVSSQKTIYRISFLSHSEKETYEVDLGVNKAVIPLNNFDLGRYTIAIYREDKIIAFSILRERPINNVDNVVASLDEGALEESILRSSLSEEEQLKRNIKPRPKTRVAKAKTKPKKKDVAIASLSTEAAKAKRKPKTKKAKKSSNDAVAKTKKKKRKSKVKINPDEEYVGIAARAETLKKKRELEEKERAKRLAKEAEESSKTKVASNDSEKSIEKKTVTYNITDIDNDKTLEKQSRKEYRETNLRPNGTKYED